MKLSDGQAVPCHPRHRHHHQHVMTLKLLYWHQCSKSIYIYWHKCLCSGCRTNKQQGKIVLKGFQKNGTHQALGSSALSFTEFRNVWSYFSPFVLYTIQRVKHFWNSFLEKSFCMDAFRAPLITLIGPTTANLNLGKSFSQSGFLLWAFTSEGFGTNSICG